MNRRGFSLLTALVLAIIALAFTGALLYMTTKSTRISGIGRRYTNSLEVAKGVTKYLEVLMCNNMLCDRTNCNGANQTINLSDISIPDYSLNATLLRAVPIYNAKGEVISHIYSIRVKVKGRKTSEKSIVDFVYKAY